MSPRKIYGNGGECQGIRSKNSGLSGRTRRKGLRLRFFERCGSTMLLARATARWTYKVFALLVACSTSVLAVTPTKSVTTLLEASQACTGDLCRFQALRKALAIDPHSVEALRALGDY